jgi:hypothetical protein
VDKQLPIEKDDRPVGLPDPARESNSEGAVPVSGWNAAVVAPL